MLALRADFLRKLKVSLSFNVDKVSIRCVQLLFVKLILLWYHSLTLAGGYLVVALRATTIEKVIKCLGKFEELTKERGLGEFDCFVLAFQSKNKRITLHKKYKSSEMEEEEKKEWLENLDEQLKTFDKYNTRDVSYSLILGKGGFQDLGNLCACIDDFAYDYCAFGANSSPKANYPTGPHCRFMDNITELSYVEKDDVSIMYIEFDFYM